MPARWRKAEVYYRVRAATAVAEDADNEDWDLDGVITAAGVKESGLRGNSRECQIEFQEVHTEVFVGLIELVQIAKRSITLEGQLRDSDSKLQKIQREW